MCASISSENPELGEAGETVMLLGGGARWQGAEGIPAGKFRAVCGPLPGPAGQPVTAVVPGNPGIHLGALVGGSRG